MKPKTDRDFPLAAKTVLGVGAHPDDLDGMAGGTIAKFVAMGASVYYLILTGGGNGSPDRDVSQAELIKTRQLEQRQAAKLLGVRDVYFAGYPDGDLRVDDQVRSDIVRYIRLVRPEVVVTFDPTVVYDLEREVINHPDHRATGQATLDAVYPYARDILSYPELMAEGLEPHIVTTVLLANYATPNYLVDISKVIDKKCTALASHISQGMSGHELQGLIKGIAEKAGAKAGCKYAEAFVCFDVHVG